ncbi:phage GP46 family protein [Pantoea stewartii]|uniref:phage GP46 family protein n=1 Tax=Pantoea stewartii TaxID=66269 RepID=UPI00333FA1E0
MGSRIWLSYRRQRLTTTVANSAASYAKELQWLIDDGVLIASHPRKSYTPQPFHDHHARSRTAPARPRNGWVWET